MTFWNIIWFIFVAYVFFAYLMVLFSIIADIFRDKETGGFAKAMWILALIIVPFLSVIVYLITRGSGMHDRADKQAMAYQAQQESYIKTVAGTASPVDEVGKAKALLDSGAISQAEFDSIKAKALT
jgi:ABC-type multidrug transport system fused ATPase/permease subunit